MLPTQTEKTEADYLSDIGNMRYAYNGIVVLDIEGNAKDVRADPESFTLGVSYAYRNGKATAPVTSGYLAFNHSEGNLSSAAMLCLRAALANGGRNPTELPAAYQRSQGVRGGSGQGAGGEKQDTRGIGGPCREAVEDKVLHFVFHNAKYDLIGLRNNWGIDLVDSPWYCTMLMVHMLNENLPDKSLDSCSKFYGGEGKAKSEVQRGIEQSFGYEFVPVWMMSLYSEVDSLRELELFEKILPEFNRQGFNGKVWEDEREWVRFIARMEAVGIATDLQTIESEIVTGELRMAELVDILGGNPGSPKFLAKLFFDDLHLPVVKRSEKTGKPSFDKYAMEEYELLLAASDNETAQLVLEYRGWSKTVSSNYKAYLDLLSPDGFLRPNYKVHGTRTRRLSCEKPNLQQIPRSTPKRWNGNLKKAFVARRGYRLWEFDYAQLEFRLAAVYSGDEVLLRAFRAGVNIFTAMAALLGWLRQDCKTFTYTVLYGGGDRRVSIVFKVSTARARRMREEFYESYPALRATQKKAAHLAKVRGYLKLWTGLRRHFADPENDAHKAFNSLTQGGAAEIVKHTGIRVGKRVDWDECKPLLQIHDSYVCEIKEGTEDYWIPIVRQTMEDVGSLHEAFQACPFTVEVKEWATDNVYTKDLESVTG